MAAIVHCLVIPSIQKITETSVLEWGKNSGCDDANEYEGEKKELAAMKLKATKNNIFHNPNKF